MKQCAPKVSVCVVTYQHEAYIEQCLQSIVSQVTDFEFEVLVGEDASTDGTREIVLRFAEKYPDIVRLVLHDTNVGSSQNHFSVHRLARGDYVCHCDGDDYWLPGKLQWQADYLDQHPEVVQVWHRMLLLNDNHQGRVGMPVRFRGLFGQKLDFRSLAISYDLVGQQSSQMYRRTALHLTDPGRKLIDYHIALDIAKSGQSILVDRVFGVYRTYSEPKSMTTSDEGRTLVDQALVDIASVYSTDKDLKLRFGSQLALRGLKAIYRHRHVAGIWAYLRHERFPVSAYYFWQALKLAVMQK